MIDPNVNPLLTTESERLLAEVTVQITDLLEAGEPVDLEFYAERYPTCVGSIRRLLPTLHELIAFGRSFRPSDEVEKRYGIHRGLPEADP